MGVCVCGLMGCEPADEVAAGGGVAGGGAVEGMDEVRDTTEREGGRGMVDENETEMELPDDFPLSGSGGRIIEPPASAVLAEGTGVAGLERALRCLPALLPLPPPDEAEAGVGVPVDDEAEW